MHPHLALGQRTERRRPHSRATQCFCGFARVDAVELHDVAIALRARRKHVVLGVSDEPHSVGREPLRAIRHGSDHHLTAQPVGARDVRDLKTLVCHFVPATQAATGAAQERGTSEMCAQGARSAAEGGAIDKPLFKYSVDDVELYALVVGGACCARDLTERLHRAPTPADEPAHVALRRAHDQLGFVVASFDHLDVDAVGVVDKLAREELSDLLGPPTDDAVPRATRLVVELVSLSVERFGVEGHSPDASSDVVAAAGAAALGCGVLAFGRAAAAFPCFDW